MARLRIRHAVAAATVAIAAAAGGAGAGTSSSLLAPVGTCPGRPHAATAGRLAQMACLVAYARTRAGLRPLRETPTLDRAAALKAQAELRCGQFSHTPCAQQFESVFAAAGYPIANGSSFGENLALGQGSLGSPRAIMHAWLDSPDHRANLLNPAWKAYGMSVEQATVFQGDHGIALWVNEFGNR